MAFNIVAVRKDGFREYRGARRVRRRKSFLKRISTQKIKWMSLSRERLHLENPLISQPFTDDFARRFSWSTNAIEGNTLSLEETIAVIDYDEVRSNHTYLEYTVVKNAYHAIQKMLLPFAKTVIDEEWVRQANGYITGNHM